MGCFSLLTILGDRDTWSVTVFGTSRDGVLKETGDPDRFDTLVRACPLHAHGDGEPLTGVLPMAGVVDRYRRFVEDVPVIAGMVAVGDAWACTNPSAGRGLTVVLVHAQSLRDVLRRHDAADDDLAPDFDGKPSGPRRRSSGSR